MIYSICIHAEAIDSCIAYSVLNDSWRTLGTNGLDDIHCDALIGLKTGWYRFLLKSNNANMPTNAQPINSCGTAAPLWWKGELPLSN